MPRIQYITIADVIASEVAYDHMRSDDDLSHDSRTTRSSWGVARHNFIDAPARSGNPAPYLIEPQYLFQSPHRRITFQPLRLFT